MNNSEFRIPHSALKLKPSSYESMYADRNEIIKLPTSVTKTHNE